MTENERQDLGKEIQMFNIRFVNTVSEYEHIEMLRSDYDSSGYLCSYENGKTKRLDASE